MTLAKGRIRNEEGQTVVEYILLLSIVVALFATASAGLRKMGLTKMLLNPLQQQFAKTYQYGHPKAKGLDDGGPEYHPRLVQGGNNNFRIFVVTGAQ